MVRYTSEQVNAMSYREWMETIAKELNNAGYKGRGFNEKTGRLEANCVPYEVGDLRFFFQGAINSAEHLNYLKSIGLINNGRCPLCGAQIKGTVFTFTDGFHPDQTYHICKSCYKEGASSSINPANRTGCLVALLLLPVTAIRSFFSSIIGLF